MSAKKNTSDLNISGLSPMVLNILSPQSTKNSPAKNQAVLDAINENAKKLIAGFEKWKLNEEKGLNSLTKIHNVKERSRRIDELPAYPELEVYCEQMRSIEAVFMDIIKQVSQMQSQIETSISIQRTLSMSSDDSLLVKLMTVEKFLIRLQELYEEELSVKRKIIERICHAETSVESHALLVTWYCYPGRNKTSKLITQLQISHDDSRWEPETSPAYS